MILFFRQHKVFPRPIPWPVPFRILLWITALEIAARFVESSSLLRSWSLTASLPSLPLKTGLFWPQNGIHLKFSGEYVQSVSCPAEKSEKPWPIQSPTVDLRFLAVVITCLARWCKPDLLACASCFCQPGHLTNQIARRNLGKMGLQDLRQGHSATLPSLVIYLIAFFTHDEGREGLEEKAFVNVAFLIVLITRRH